jgi:hypothetical protein
MFECEMTGCFDSATHDIKFVNEKEEYQICDSCVDYWKHNDENDVESIKEFANRKETNV